MHTIQRREIITKEVIDFGVVEIRAKPQIEPSMSSISDDFKESVINHRDNVDIIKL